MKKTAARQIKTNPGIPLLKKSVWTPDQVRGDTWRTERGGPSRSKHSRNPNICEAFS